MCLGTDDPCNCLQHVHRAATRAAFCRRAFCVLLPLYLASLPLTRLLHPTCLYSQPGAMPFCPKAVFAMPCASAHAAVSALADVIVGE
jgi:hypothetical protein